MSASITIGQHLVAPHMAEFSSQYPEIDIELNLTNRRVDIIGEGFDVVIRVGSLHDSTLVSKYLGSDNAQLFASSAYLKHSGTPTSIEDLEKHRLITMSDSPQSHQWIFTDSQGHSISTPVQAFAAINDLTAIQRMVMDGMGIAFLPRYFDSEENKLVRIFDEWQSPNFDYHALYPSHRGMTLKLRVWLDFLCEKFAQFRQMK